MQTNAPPGAVPWPLVAGLATLNLIHPIAHLSGLGERWGRGPTSLTLAVLVGLAWVLLVAFSGVRRPVRVCVLAGLTTSAGLVVLGLALGPALDGVGISRTIVLLAVVPLTVVQVAFGVATGVLARGLQGLLASVHGTDARHDVSRGVRS